MRVLHIITRMILGGAQENTMLSVLGQMELSGYEVALLTGPTTGPEGNIVPLLQEKGATIIEEPTLVRSVDPVTDLLAYKALRKHIRNFKPDVVHTHSSKAGVVGRAAAWKEKVPFVTHTIHGLPFHAYQSELKNKIYISAEKYAAKKCHKIISVADAMTEQALAAGVGCEEQYQTVYSGMEIEPFLKSDKKRNAARKKYGFSDDDFVIGKVARLFELKGHEYLFTAFEQLAAKYPNLKLFLIGNGIWREKFENILQEKGLLDRVVFAGLVERERIPEVISATDMVAHCSLREGLARVLPQALLCAKPVASFDVDGAKEVIIPEKTGYLIKPQDVEGLVAAISDVISSPEKSRKMASNGRDLCREKFDWKIMVKALAEIYEKGPYF